MPRKLSHVERARKEFRKSRVGYNINATLSGGLKTGQTPESIRDQLTSPVRVTNFKHADINPPPPHPEPRNDPRLYTLPTHSPADSRCPCYLCQQAR